MVDVRAEYDTWHSAVSTSPALDTPWYRMVQAALEPRDLAGRRVLEIACGRGDFATWCVQRPAPPALLVAGDLSGAALRIARGRVAAPHPTAFVQADVEAIALGSATFDTVICCETLEHLDEPRAALKELARVLRPGGRLFLTTPNYLGPMGAYRAYLRLTGRRYSEEGQPVNRFLLAPLVRRWVRRAGFSIVGTDGTGHYLPWPGRAPILVGERSRWFPLFGLHSLIVAVRPLRRLRGHGKDEAA